MFSGSGSVSTLRSVIALLGPTGPKDVERGVNVGVGLMPARLASERRAVPVLRRAVPTASTGAAGVAGLHCDNSPIGAFSLIGNHREQSSPPGVLNTTIQSPLHDRAVGRIATIPVGPGSGSPDEVRDGKRLMHNEVVIVHELAGEAVQCVLPAVAHGTVLRRDALNCPAATLRSGALRSEVPLSIGETLRSSAPATVFGDKLPVACCNQYPQPQIDPHRVTRRR
jgi:hypothetical protein